MSITPAERYGENSAVAREGERFGDVLPAADFEDLGPDPLADDHDPIIDELEREEELLKQAKALVARVEDAADKLETQVGFGIEEAERAACERLHIDYDTYMKAYMRVAETQPSAPVATSSIAVRGILENLHEERMKGMTDSERNHYLAQKRARAIRNPRVG